MSHTLTISINTTGMVRQPAVTGIVFTAPANITAKDAMIRHILEQLPELVNEKTLGAATFA